MSEHFCPLSNYVANAYASRPFQFGWSRQNKVAYLNVLIYLVLAATIPGFAQDQKSEGTAAESKADHAGAAKTDLFFLPVANHDKTKILSAARNLRIRHHLPTCDETDESLIKLFQEISKMPESASHDDRIDMGVLADYKPVADFILGRMVIGLSGFSEPKPKHEYWWQKSHFKSTKLRIHH